MKKRLTQSEEFEIMKIVLDKFLWFGMIIMTFGVYSIFNDPIDKGVSYLVIGAVLLILFLVLIIREYEVIR